MIVYIGNILSGHGKSKSFIELLSAKLELNYEIKIASNKRNKVFRFLEMLFVIFKYRKKTNVVLIDAYSTSAFWYAFFAALECKFFSIPYIPVLHGGNLPNRYTSTPGVVRILLKNAVTVVSPSLFLFNFFKEKGFSITYIPNFVEINKYPFFIRTTYKPKLLWVRAFHKIYNPALAIETLFQLSKVIENPSLCMIGAFKDDSVTEVKQLISDYRLESSVEITGIMQKHDWIAKAKDYDIFINTTNVDNMPISLIEAMALGLPVVSTNVGGIPYLIDSNQNGLLVPANNPEAMVKAITKLIEDLPLTQSLVLEARERVENFDWDKIKYSWYQILDTYEANARKQ